MKGLIIKDLTVLKSSLKTVFIIVVLFAFMGIKSGSAYMATFASVYAAILPMTCMAYDERSRFNRYAVAMPISPRDIALSKYITGLILAAAATAIALVIALFTKAPIGETAAGCMLIPVFYHTFMLPVMFKFGVEKSRLMVLIGVVIPAVGISLWRRQVCWMHLCRNSAQQTKRWLCPFYLPLWRCSICCRRF